ASGGCEGDGFFCLLSEAVVGVVVLDGFFFSVAAVGGIDCCLCFISLPVILEIRFGNGFICPAVYASLLRNAGIVNAVGGKAAFRAGSGVGGGVVFLCPYRTDKWGVSGRITVSSAVIGCKS
ncbi:MAG: hypothetical protein K1V92_03605, partial [Bacteroides acidifaciens]